MPSIAKRWLLCFAGAIFVLYSLSSWHTPLSSYRTFKVHSSSVAKWRQAQDTRWPLTEFVALPTGPAEAIPKIQANKYVETDDQKKERQRRLKAVKDTMKHSWKGYRTHAWLKDEVTPLSGTYADKFGGWAATLVDSLDTLWIMDMKGDFYEALGAVAKIDFGFSDQQTINVFETTIRYLGGFLSAYDLSGEKILLEKAVELGEMLYVAFDTSNRMPIPRWDWEAALTGLPQEAPASAVVAEIASLCLEFTRLSQLTGDKRFYDAIDRITRVMAKQQNETYIPGLWPVYANARDADFSSGRDFSIGAMVDSAFEYLPKMHMLLGGKEPIYRQMYQKSVSAMNKHIFYRALNPENREIMFPGEARPDWSVKHGQEESDIYIVPNMQHLSCYAGGMVGIGAKLFSSKPDEHVARALTDGCIWAYEGTPSGIMPEIFRALPCERATNPDCRWSEDLWLNASVLHGGAMDEERDGGIGGARSYVERMNLAPGYVEAVDPRYLLRPEAIESVWIMYRITADRTLQDHGWNMFNAVANATRTKVAHAAVKDVMADRANVQQLDNMESFWTAETLKYYYLLFSDSNVISLDEYVLNTEAHPFKRPKGGVW